MEYGIWTTVSAFILGWVMEYGLWIWAMGMDMGYGYGLWNMGYGPQF